MPARQPIRILDPACGDGALLRAIAEESGRKVHLIGGDLDAHALASARTKLPRDAMLLHVDALAPGEGSTSPVVAWEGILGAGALSGIVANPPWGADTIKTAEGLRDLGYQLASGQFDTYELFIELCVALMPQGATMGFIIPDSIFLPQHRPLREMLLNTTRLDLVARLGEGIFPGVYRGTVVLVVTRGTAGPEHQVECLRLTKPWRQRILAGECSYEDAKAALVHLVPQSRFAADPEQAFDIDVRVSESGAFTKIAGAGGAWSRAVRSGRGVELSKSGAVLVCENCGETRARPRAAAPTRCKACGCGPSSNTHREETIIKPMCGSIPAGWERLIVGEDVDRYRCTPSRWIRTGLKGINYKEPEAFAGRKLLIRKTGVGLKAAIDETGAYTNQVVFHYIPGSSAPEFYLDYLLGVLCSRVLLAFHLKGGGEAEWRSHPYITQAVIGRLPIPQIREGQLNWAQAQAIAAAVARRRTKDSHGCEEDLQVESLVAGLYGLQTEDCEWVLRVLEESQGLEPIRSLRLPPGGQFTPVRI
jgi:hypothetical protein